MNYYNDVKKFVLLDDSFQSKYLKIKRLKEMGAEQAEVKKCLLMLKVEHEEKEDLILDLLDYVTGYCPKNMKIW